MKFIVIVMVFFLTLWSGFLFTPGYVFAEEAPTVILFVLDASGSMNKEIEGKSKIATAKKILSDFIPGLPENSNVGLEIYGHRLDYREDGSCQDIEMVVPVEKNDVQDLQENIAKITARGQTPLATSLQQGAEILSGIAGKKTIILISDGEETCGGDPVKAAYEIRKKLGIDVVIHVVGFDVSDEQKKQLAEIASAGGGKYFSADNAAQLKNSLAEAVQLKDIFVEEFDKPFLTEQWSILNDNPDNMSIEGGILYIVGMKGDFSNESLQNVLLYDGPLESKNYEVIIKFTVELTAYGSHREQQLAGIVLFADKENMLSLIVRGAYTRDGTIRQALLTKTLSGTYSEIGKVIGWKDPAPITYYLKIVKNSFRYTGFYSLDGNEWTKVGTLAMLGKKVRPGLYAVIGKKGTETIVSFDSFKIRAAE